MVWYGLQWRQMGIGETSCEAIVIAQLLMKVRTKMKQKGKTLCTGFPKWKYLETFHVEFHRAYVWIVVLIYHCAFRYLAQTELYFDFVQVKLSYRGPLLLWDNGSSHLLRTTKADI